MARPAGWIEGWWPDPEGKTPAHGHLAYACEFLPGSRDAWREATEAIAATVVIEATGATVVIEMTGAAADRALPATAPVATMR